MGWTIGMIRFCGVGATEAKRVHGAGTGGNQRRLPGLLEQQAATLKAAEGKDKKEFLSKKIVLYPGAQGGRRFSGFGARANGALCNGGAGFTHCVYQWANLLLAKRRHGSASLRYGRH